MQGKNTVGIVGTGSYLPEKILNNHDFERMVDTSDEWIFSRTGIRERRIAPPGTPTSDLCIEAAGNALDMAGLKPDDIDLIIVGTISPDYRFPSTACMVQHKLGCRQIGAFDVSAACSGFLYGLSIASNYLGNGECKVALVLGAEMLSSLTNYEDRTSCILFGDAAGAAIVHSGASNGHIIDVTMGSDGSGGDIMIVPSSGSAMPVSPETVEKKLHKMVIRGREIYKYSVSKVGSIVAEICEQNDFKVEDLGMIIPHQMNMRIIEAAAKRLGTPVEKWYANIERYGNTSAATIPVALDEVVRNDLVKRDDLIAMTAFGGGITWAGGLLRW